MQIVAGCDGGGTKCTVRVLLCNDDGSTLRMSQATSGPANVQSDPELALRNILWATSQALQNARVPTDATIDSFVAALAGAGDYQRRQEWQAVLSGSIVARQISVVADVGVLFAASEMPQCEAAVALVVGTGSIAWARDQTGRESRAGGLGPLVGDAGSGFWIGNEAIKRLASFAAASGTDRLRRSDIARRSKDLFDATDTDEVARAIISEAAEHITSVLLAAGSDIETSREKPVQWLCAGGVAVNQPLWLKTIRQNCACKNLFLDVPVLIREPVIGAVNLALQSATRR